MWHKMCPGAGVAPDQVAGLEGDLHLAAGHPQRGRPRLHLHTDRHPAPGPAQVTTELSQ